MGEAWPSLNVSGLISRGAYAQIGMAFAVMEHKKRMSNAGSSWNPTIGLGFADCREWRISWKKKT